MSSKFSNNHFCPRTNYVCQNLGTTAQNFILHLLCLPIGIKLRFLLGTIFNFYEKSRILNFSVSFFLIKNYEKHYWKEYILKNALHILPPICIEDFFCKKIWKIPVDVVMCGHYVGHRHNLSRFLASCVSLVYFLLKST